MSFKLSKKCFKIVNEYFERSRIMFNDENFLFPLIKNQIVIGESKISYNEFRKSVLSLLKNAGIDIKGLGTHSLRIGACTEATRAGIPDHLIDAFGRWSFNSSARAVSYTHLTLPTKRIV